MIKIFKALSIAAVTILTFTACGNKDNQASNSNDSIPEQQNTESQTESAASGVPVSYGTITESCDWGPSVTKLIIAFDHELTEVSANDFTASVERTYAGTADLVQELSYETFSFDVSPTAKGDRNIENAYLSDENGNTINGESKYVTLEMTVNPDEGYGNPIGAEIETGLNLNVLLDCNYTITYKDNNGEDTLCDTRDDTLCQIQITDDFTHNQMYTTQTSSILEDEYENDTLYYASYEPQDGDSHPLLIWLHGAGEGGTDTRIPLLGNKATAFDDEAFQSIMGGAYVLVPQSPTVWMNVTGQTYDLSADHTASMYTQTLMELIEEYVETHPQIDKNKIYIGGCSNGGYMTMNMIINYPEYFAAAFPVCEAYPNEFITDTQIENIKNMPIWFTHAANDPLVIPDETTVATYKRLLSAGADNIHFTYWTDVHDTSGKYTGQDGLPYSYFGHGSWIYLFNNECTLDNDYVEGQTTDAKGSGQTIFEWLAEQSK